MSPAVNRFSNLWFNVKNSQKIESKVHLFLEVISRISKVISRNSWNIRVALWRQSILGLWYKMDPQHPVMLLTEEFAVDLDFFFAPGKAYCALSVTSNRCIPVKSILGWSAVVPCQCEMTQLLFVLLCGFGAVRKFDFRLLTNSTLNKRRPVKIRQCSYKD